jgi:hypothetical protein
MDFGPISPVIGAMSGPKYAYEGRRTRKLLRVATLDTISFVHFRVQMIDNISVLSISDTVVEKLIVGHPFDILRIPDQFLKLCPLQDLAKSH